MFVDEAKIHVKAGSGGNGCESFFRDRYMRFPKPDGGDGGKGGDIVFVADRSIQTLLDFRFKQHYKAEKGGHASSKGKNGRCGKDCILRVPMGTLIKDKETGLLIKDLCEDQQSIIAVRGGRGGIGNARRKVAVSPKDGEERTIRLELKLIADVGLIGFPNAGKSTLITGISKVKSKIASYPFTTKQPILGFVEHDEQSFIVADLPGIIEGAHTGRGLGDRFLRHAERTKLLVHVIDMAGSEGRDPLDDFSKIERELAKYEGDINIGNKIVVANKMDLLEAEKNLKRFKKKYGDEVMAVSSLQRKGLDVLVKYISEKLC